MKLGTFNFYSYCELSTNYLASYITQQYSCMPNLIVKVHPSVASQVTHMKTMKPNTMFSTAFF